MNKKWEKIDDDKVYHVWKCSNGKCEDEYVNPTFYQDNGTPVCECDDDMIYDRTEIETEK